jgi:hypothetical protein
MPIKTIIHAFFNFFFQLNSQTTHWVILLPLLQSVKFVLVSVLVFFAYFANQKKCGVLFKLPISSFLAC